MDLPVSQLPGGKGQPKQYWTEEETNVLLDLAEQGMTTRELADYFGRSFNAIQRQRTRAQQGRATLRDNAWTEDELDVLRSTSHLTTIEVTPLLPGRSRQSVWRARQHLAETEGLNYLTPQKDPNTVGLRRLVAKTCSDCGVLMDARWFRRNQQGGCWTSKCGSCARERTENWRERNRERSKSERVRALQRAAHAKFDALTGDRAVNNGKLWTEADHETLSSPDLTILEKALKLGRTYKATQHALSKGGYTSKIGLGDKEKGRWVISRPEDEQRAA